MFYIRPEIFRVSLSYVLFLVLCVVSVLMLFCVLARHLFSFSPASVLFFFSAISPTHVHVALHNQTRSIARFLFFSSWVFANNRHIEGKFIKLFCLSVCDAMCVLYVLREKQFSRRRVYKEEASVCVTESWKDGGKFLFIFNFHYLHLISCMYTFPCASGGGSDATSRTTGAEADFWPRRAGGERCRGFEERETFFIYFSTNACGMEQHSPLYVSDVSMNFFCSTCKHKERDFSMFSATFYAFLWRLSSLAALFLSLSVRLRLCAGKLKISLAFPISTSFSRVTIVSSYSFFAEYSRNHERVWAHKPVIGLK